VHLLCNAGISGRRQGFGWFCRIQKSPCYLPHSGQVLKEIPELSGFAQTVGSLHFAIDEPLSLELITKLIEVRKAQAFGD